MNIQWFPGHMAKTKRILSENLKLVDVVIEILDARIPLSSKNPEFDIIIGNKKKIVVLNKSDLADNELNGIWERYFRKNGAECISVDSLKGKGMNKVISSLKNMMSETFEKDLKKGRIFRPIRTMVGGIPNSGKSSFINKLAGRAITITGDKPGVTKSKQWIRIRKDIELLDTPGILWPKFEDEKTGLNLAFTGAIPDDIIDTVEIAEKLLKFLVVSYPQSTKERFKLEPLQSESLLESAGRKRGCLVSGGKVDLNRISVIVLDEFRGGKLGRITLEKP